MTLGLDGEIHHDTQWALLAAVLGGAYAGYALAEYHPIVFVVACFAAAFVPLWIVPDADTVATEWIVRQDEYREAGEDGGRDE